LTISQYIAQPKTSNIYARQEISVLKKGLPEIMRQQSICYLHVHVVSIC